MTIKIAVVGAGAAGYFFALNFYEKLKKKSAVKIDVLEQSSRVLNKVRISGGGRCNVTHFEFDEKRLSQSYPRGQRELLGPFHHFGTQDVMNWFEKRGVSLKVEVDGRVFPKSNLSSEIIDLFESLRRQYKINLKSQYKVSSIKQDGDQFILNQKDRYDYVFWATGSDKSAWNVLSRFGESVSKLYPSLFSFHINDPLIKELSGLSFKKVLVSFKRTKGELSVSGDLLITHKGLSGPAILKLSSFSAVDFGEKNYNFKIKVNFLNEDLNDDNLRKIYAKKNVAHLPVLKKLPQRFVQNAIALVGLHEKKVADLSKTDFETLRNTFLNKEFEVTGKSTHKEEFVTAGGVSLKTINFKTFEAKSSQGLFFAGEVLNIDAITGGYNFQNAWTGSYIAATALSDRLNQAQQE